MIFKLGNPVFVIAKNLNTSEAQVYRYLNGEKMPPDAEAKLKRFWLHLTDMQKAFETTK